MIRHALYDLISETSEFVFIKDVGFNKLTVTNDAKFVVADLAEKLELGNRRIFYVDSKGSIDELLH